MIKINDKYYLDTDAFSYIIREKKINKKTNEEYYDAIAFCGNLRQLKDYLINKEILENVELLQNIDKVIELSNTFDKVILHNKINDLFGIGETE